MHPCEAEGALDPCGVLVGPAYIVLRALLSRVFKFLVCDRGVADFIAWIVTTLNYPASCVRVEGAEK